MKIQVRILMAHNHKLQQSADRLTGRINSVQLTASTQETS